MLVHPYAPHASLAPHILNWLDALGFVCELSGDGYTDFLRRRPVPDTDPDLAIERDDQLTFIEGEGRWYGDTRLTDCNGDYLAHNGDYGPSSDNPYDVVRWLDATVLELNEVRRRP